MPNHYTNVIMLTGCLDEEGNRFDVDAFLANKPELCEQLRPTPKELRGTTIGAVKGQREVLREGNDILGDRIVPEAQWRPWLKRYGASNAFDWQTAAWGTKWGDYNWAGCALPGDSTAVMLTFVTAWSPPNESLRNQILRHLMRLSYATSATWIGLDPYDDSIVVLHGTTPA